MIQLSSAFSATSSTTRSWVSSTLSAKFATSSTRFFGTDGTLCKDLDLELASDNNTTPASKS